MCFNFGALDFESITLSKQTLHTNNFVREARI